MQQHALGWPPAQQQRWASPHLPRPPRRSRLHLQVRAGSLSFAHRTRRLSPICPDPSLLPPPLPRPVAAPTPPLPQAGAQPSVLNPPPPPRSHLEVVAGEVEGGEGGQRGQGRALRGTGRWTAGAIRGAREGSNGGRAGWQCATPDRYFVKPIKYLYESLDIL